MCRFKTVADLLKSSDKEWYVNIIQEFQAEAQKIVDEARRQAEQESVESQKQLDLREPVINMMSPKQVFLASLAFSLVSLMILFGLNCG